MQPGDNVAVCLQRRAFAPVCLLAALKCGAAFVPVAPDSPARRLEVILDECQPKLIVTEGNRREVIEQLVAAVTRVVPQEALDSSRLKADSPSWETGSQDAPCTPETIAYIIYTSGSSGIPKGVKVSHQVLLSARGIDGGGLRNDGNRPGFAILRHDVRPFLGTIARSLVSGSHGGGSSGCDVFGRWILA